VRERSETSSESETKPPSVLSWLSAVLHTHVTLFQMVYKPVEPCMLQVPHLQIFLDWTCEHQDPRAEGHAAALRVESECSFLLELGTLLDPHLGELL